MSCSFIYSNEINKKQKIADIISKNINEIIFYYNIFKNYDIDTNIFGNNIDINYKSNPKKNQINKIQLMT